MCFVCPPSVVSSLDAVTLVYTRVPDPVSSPHDHALTEDVLAAFEMREWLYVGLTATVHEGGVPLASATLYGVPEGLTGECAFDDVTAMAWVGGEALDRALSDAGRATRLTA